jgi:pentatricopeptide repeat protein
LMEAEGEQTGQAVEDEEVGRDEWRGAGAAQTRGAAGLESPVASEIALYGRLRDVARARHALEHARQSGSATVHEYTAMLHVYLGVGHVDEAEDLFVEMREAGIAANAVTYAGMIDGLAAAGDTFKAMQLFWEARSQGLVPFSSFIVDEHEQGRQLVDLHGMSALTSIVAVEFALAFNIPGRQLVLVTGRGRHSRAGEPVVRPAVESFLFSNGIRFAPAAGNDGRLVIEELRARLPLVVFCGLLLAIMWLIGALVAKQWIAILREKNVEASRRRQLARLREELRGSLLEHAQGRRAHLADLMEALEKEA